MTGSNKKFPGLASRELTAAISAILAATGAATAQEQPAAGATLEEVIVTATKREERLQDVPESITAISSDDILKRGLFQMDDYARLVPGLTVSDREPGGTTIVFRGVVTSGLQFGSVSSSALYLDEQPITQSGRNPDPRLIDVERVEALRGPQGTLYGASSQSGTLRVITNKPDPSKLETWFDAQLTSVHDGGEGYDVSAMLNLPLAEDKVALRLVGFTSKDAGFIDNVLGDSEGGTYNNSNKVKKDVNSTETTGGRAALGFDVTDNFKATLSAVFQDVHLDGHSDINAGTGDLHQVRFENESMDDHWYQVALTLDANLSFGHAVFAASYFNRDFAYEADASTYEYQFNQTFIDCVPTPTYECLPTYDFGGDPRGFAKNHEETEITTFEARLSSPTGTGSRWSWLIGAFYSEEKGKTAFDSFIRGYENTGAFKYFSYYEQNLTGSPLPATETWFLGRYDTELDQVAAFGELGFNVTENFSITAGGRWFDYDRKFGQIQEQPEGFTGDTRLDSVLKTSETGTVWKLNGTYKFSPDHLVYATYSEGFRVGGANPLKGNTVLPRVYDSDTLKN
ncbi:MAG TPA: TonB-dependent receptor, partial [Steroidobacteraceae bacterium]